MRCRPGSPHSLRFVSPLVVARFEPSGSGNRQSTFDFKNKELMSICLIFVLQLLTAEVTRAHTRLSEVMQGVLGPFKADGRDKVYFYSLYEIFIALSCCLCG